MLKRLFFVATLLIAPGLTGCGDTDLDDIVDKVKETASDGAEKVKESVSDAADSVVETTDQVTEAVEEQVGVAGSFDLTLGQSVKIAGCYAKLVTISDAHPQVFQISSYSAPDRESTPSAMLHAQVTVGSIAELASQTVPARLFVQTADGNVWYSDDASPVQVTVTSIAEGKLTATLAGGVLRNTGSDQTIPAGGTLEAIISE